MPCVCLQRRRIQLAGSAHGVLERKFLQQYRYDCRPQRKHAGLREILPPEPAQQGAAGTENDSAGHQQQRHPDDGGRQSLVLAVAVVVVAVGGLGAELYEYQDDGVGKHVGQGMHGVGDHGGTSAEYAGDELEHRQQKVDGAAHKGHAGYFTLAVHSAVNSFQRASQYARRAFFSSGDRNAYSMLARQRPLSSSSDRSQPAATAR